MDSNSKAVMMAWEKPLMEAHAKAVCSGGGHILNIGFGMGLVDTAIQQYKPATHTIIEAHPEVYNRMLHTGWGEKDNVKIIFGRWQDVLPQLESYDGNSIFSCSPIHIQYVLWCFYILLYYIYFYVLFIFYFFKTHTLASSYRRWNKKDSASMLQSFMTLFCMIILYIDCFLSVFPSLSHILASMN